MAKLFSKKDDKTIGKEIEEEITSENQEIVKKADEIYDEIESEFEIDESQLDSFFPSQNDIEEYVPDLGHSWEKEKVFEGIFLGMKPIVFALNNAPGWVFTLQQRDGRKKSAVASFQIKRFLTDNNVPLGCWVRFEKIGEIPLQGGMRMSEFKVQYDKSKMKVRTQLLNPAQVSKFGEQLEKAKMVEQKLLPF